MTLPSFEDGVNYSWQLTAEFNTLVKTFHDRHALCPSSLKAARKLHTACIRRLEQKLKELHPDLFAELIYTGSSYEGVKVRKNKDDDDIEFDIMVVMKAGSDLQIEPSNKAGFVFLRLSNEEKLSDVIQKSTVDGDISGEKIMSSFRAILKKCIKAVEMDERTAFERNDNESSDMLTVTVPSNINREDSLPSNINLETSVPSNISLEASVPSNINLEASVTSTINRETSVTSNINRETSVTSNIDRNDSLQRSSNDCADDLEQSAFFRELSKNIVLRNHGPAVQMDVMIPSTGKKFYSVDMVPTLKYQLSSQKRNEASPIPKYYVAKPFGDSDSGCVVKRAWRQSFSRQEKDQFPAMDENNGCRKQILRILKVIRNREAGLAMLTTYHLKTVLFREIAAIKEDEYWKSEYQGQRLIGMLRRLRDELFAGRIEHFYLSEVNLLDSTKQMNSKHRDTTVRQVAQRIKSLINSKTKLEKILKSKY